MNKDNASQFLPLVKALEEGKTIQYRAYTDEKWEDINNPAFDGNPEDYRVKPEPREWFLYRPPGHSELIAYTSPVLSYDGGIRVREILD